MTKITITVTHAEKEGEFKLDISMFPKKLPMFEFLGILQVAIRQTIEKGIQDVEEENKK